MIIAVLNQKGGVGKTTLATHLATELAYRGERALVVDADPQGSALDWSQTRAQRRVPRLAGVIGLARETLHHEVPVIARNVDHVVIDGPPRVTALARSAILASDLVLARSCRHRTTCGRAPRWWRSSPRPGCSSRGCVPHSWSTAVSWVR